MPNTGCCCDCPTKEEAGLPDSITVTFSVTSSSGTGMPSDSVIDSCGGNDILADYTADPVLMEALTSLDFEYTHTEGCCHYYSSTGAETPCGETGYTDIGGSPFKFIFDGDEVTYDLWQANVSTDDGVNLGCCADDYLFMSCLEAGGGSIEITDGTAWIPAGLYAKGTLTICITDNLVTVAINITLLADYAVLGASGTVLWLNAGRDISTCEQYTWESSGSGTPTSGCDFVTGGQYLTDSQDVSGESGTTIWDKIKAATWSSDYELAMCGIGGGCGLTVHGEEADCIINSGCFVYNDGDPTFIEEENYPFNQDCIYSVGTVSLVFTDGP